jgi:hypothetical protein
MIFTRWIEHNEVEIEMGLFKTFLNELGRNGVKCGSVRYRVYG